MRIVVGSNGRIQRYQYKAASGEFRDLAKENVLHLCNNRVGDEIHGTSILEATEWAIEAREEALEIYRKIIKRSLALGVLYIDSSDADEINRVMTQYKQAIDRVDMVVLPKGVAEIKDAKITVQDFLSWIQYLENFIYQALGVPKIIMGGSEQFTQAGGKMGYLTFEQVYAAEQRKLEQDIWAQLQIKISFQRPVSLKENVQEEEERNTGQTAIQPNDTEAALTEENAG